MPAQTDVLAELAPVLLAIKGQKCAAQAQPECGKDRVLEAWVSSIAGIAPSNKPTLLSIEQGRAVVRE